MAECDLIVAYRLDLRAMVLMIDRLIELGNVKPTTGSYEAWTKAGAK